MMLADIPPVMMEWWQLPFPDRLMINRTVYLWWSRTARDYLYTLAWKVGRMSYGSGSCALSLCSVWDY